MKHLFVFLPALISVNFLSAQTYNGAVGAINDLVANNFTCTVSGLSPATIDTSAFGLETVCINLTHTYDSDLLIELLSPDGTTITLVREQGGGGDDFTNTCFNETAPASITTGAPPFTGNFTPQGFMGRLNNGQNGNGTWTLRITDLYGGDTGNLIGWTLAFGTNPASNVGFTSSNLPIVVLNTNNQNIPQGPKIMADMGIIYNGPNVRNYLNDPYNNYNGKIGIDIRGNYSAILPQKPYGVETRDVNGNSINVSLLGMPAENDWALLANYNDKSFMRNLLAFDIFDKTGHYAPRAKLVEVVLNGDYQGVYLLCETIKRDANRVDIARLDPVETTWPDVSGGYMLKIDYWDNANSWQLNYAPIGHPNMDIHMVYVYPDPDDLVPQQQTYIQNFVNDYETALYGTAFADTAIGYRKYISVRSFMDYWIVNELSRNVDGHKKSCHYYKEKDNANGTIGKMKAGPVWDFDWAWKNIPGCVNSEMTDGSGWSYLVNDCSPDVNSPAWYVRLLQDSNFANQLHCRWFELRATVLDTTYLFNYMDSVVTLVNEAQQRHYDYWGHMGQATGAPEVDPPAQSYQEEVDRLKQFIRLRLAFLDANMPGNMNGCNLTSVHTQPAYQPAVSAWPNPFTGMLNVQLQLAQQTTVQVSVTDMAGRTVLSGTPQQLGAGTQQLGMDASVLPAGVYLLHVQAGESVQVLRVVKGE
ncbi:MAG: CotH kinase family protein [Bacteroidia bacterium]|jgi:subtilisin-like proprotein convertase family protein|nr:CotH kinase family protein [Bacteroidia bacterium]